MTEKSAQQGKYLARNYGRKSCHLLGVPCPDKPSLTSDPLFQSAVERHLESEHPVLWYSELRKTVFHWLEQWHPVGFVSNTSSVSHQFWETKERHREVYRLTVCWTWHFELELVCVEHILLVVPSAFCHSVAFWYFLLNCAHHRCFSHLKSHNHTQCSNSVVHLKCQYIQPFICQSTPGSWRCMSCEPDLPCSRKTSRFEKKKTSNWPQLERIGHVSWVTTDTRQKTQLVVSWSHSFGSQIIDVWSPVLLTLTTVTSFTPLASAPRNAVARDHKPSHTPPTALPLLGARATVQTCTEVTGIWGCGTEQDKQSIRETLRRKWVWHKNNVKRRQTIVCVCVCVCIFWKTTDTCKIKIAWKGHSKGTDESGLNNVPNKNNLKARLRDVKETQALHFQFLSFCTQPKLTYEPLQFATDLHPETKPRMFSQAVLKVHCEDYPHCHAVGVCSEHNSPNETLHNQSCSHRP